MRGGVWGRLCGGLPMKDPSMSPCTSGACGCEGYWFKTSQEL